MRICVLLWMQTERQVHIVELRQLRYFLSVADTRSFVSAASKLFISRQAISKAISQLEDELNVELFMRGSNGAFLTPAGIMFYERVRTLVMELDDLSADMKNYGTRFHQHIRLTFSISVMSLFEQKLLEYKNAQVNLDIHYQESPKELCLQLLQEHKVDMIVTPMLLKDPMVVCDRLMDSPLGILIQWDHKLSPLNEIELSDLQWIPLAVHSDHFPGDVYQSSNLRVQYQGYDFQRLFHLVEQGLCALILPKCFTPLIPAATKWIPIADTPPWTLYKAYTRTSEKNQLYSAVLDELNIRIFRDVVENKGG